MAKSMHDINLLPSHGDTLLLQFLNWALTIGRLLIILVETLALVTFLYRFSLDMQIQDLKDKIKIQRSIVTSYKSQEDTFRNFQSRLVLLKKLNAQSENGPNVLNDIIQMGKGYITFRNVYVSNTIIRIETQAPTVAPLTAFVNSLKKYPPVASISIDKVENKTSSVAIIVGISVYLKQNDQVIDSAGDQLQTGTPFSDQVTGQ